MELKQIYRTQLRNGIIDIARYSHYLSSINQNTLLQFQIDVNGKIQYLNLRNLGLFSLPDYLMDLSELKHLNLAFNNLISLPESICKLKQLCGLNLFSNRISNLPVTFHQLNCLWILDLSNNRLESIPESIYSPNLTILKLANNLLTTLPVIFNQIVKLTELDISHNLFTELPSYLWSFPKLKKLTFAGNRLQDQWAQLEDYDILNEVTNWSPDHVIEKIKSGYRISNVDRLLISKYINYIVEKCEATKINSNYLEQFRNDIENLSQIRVNNYNILL
jgi:Leucine-rich repeat (LRR) protein